MRGIYNRGILLRGLKSVIIYSIIDRGCVLWSHEIHEMKKKGAAIKSMWDIKWRKKWKLVFFFNLSNIFQVMASLKCEKMDKCQSFRVSNADHFFFISCVSWLALFGNLIYIYKYFKNKTVQKWFIISFSLLSPMCMW